MMCWWLCSCRMYGRSWLGWFCCLFIFLCCLLFLGWFFCWRGRYLVDWWKMCFDLILVGRIWDVWGIWVVGRGGCRGWIGRGGFGGWRVGIWLCRRLWGGSDIWYWGIVVVMKRRGWVWLWGRLRRGGCWLVLLGLLVVVLGCWVVLMGVFVCGLWMLRWCGGLIGRGMVLLLGGWEVGGRLIGRGVEVCGLC